MPRAGTPRRTKTSEKPTARRSRSNPAPAPITEEAASGSPISHEEIAARAYELFLARGGQQGDDLADWFRAEAELLRERSST